MNEPSGTRLEEERRRLWDRRAADPRRGRAERRARDRRRAPFEVVDERRGGFDRRTGEPRRTLERRTLTDRRRGVRWRETPTPFTPEQIAGLRTLFAAPGPVRCPACGSRVALGWARHTATEKARRVMCLGCGRGAIIPDGGAARILVVGANEALRDILQTALTSAGHDVVEAPDGGVALLANDAVPADVILLDVQTPGRMEAREFVRRLRGFSPDARVIALVPRSSTADTEPPAPVPSIGAVRLMIQLPLSREELLRAVDEARREGGGGFDP